MVEGSVGCHRHRQDRRIRIALSAYLIVLVGRTGGLLPREVEAAAAGASASTAAVQAGEAETRAEACPSQCLCGIGTSKFTTGYFITVDCRRAKLSFFPSTTPSNTQLILLKGNVMSSLQPTTNDVVVGGDDDNQSGRRWSRLTEIDLSFNRFASMPDLSAFQSLKIIDLSFNQMTTLSNASSSSNSGLETLVLRNNRIESIDAGFFFCRRFGKLIRLNLNGNRLESLSREMFAGLENLKELHAADNKISEIQEGAFDRFARLEMLSLGGNRLMRLSGESFSGLEKLKHLNLSSNFLGHVPGSSLLIFQALKTLFLDSNPIFKVPSRALHSLTVQELSLSRMPRLAIVDGQAIYRLRQLKVVRMHDNPQLAYLDPHSIAECFQVSELHLHNNGLRVVPEALIRSLPELRRIRLDGNPIRCDCASARQTSSEDHRIDNNKSPAVTPGEKFNSCNVTKLSTAMNEHDSDSTHASANNSATLINSANSSTSAKSANLTDFADTSISRNDNATLNCRPPIDWSLFDNFSSNESCMERLSTGNCRPEVLRLFDDTVYYEYGDVVEIECRAVGTPLPNFYWANADGRDIIDRAVNNSIRFRLSASTAASGTLRIDNLKTTGVVKYVCIGENSEGRENRTVTLQDYKSGGGWIVYRTVGADFVSVEWGGIDVSSVRFVQYVITYCGLKSGLVKNSKRGRVFLRKYMRTYWFGNLSPLTLYEFCLAYAKPDRDELVYLNCSTVETKKRSIGHSPDGEWYRLKTGAFGPFVAALAFALPFMVCSALFVIRQYKQRRAYMQPNGSQRKTSSSQMTLNVTSLSCETLDLHSIVA